MPRFTYAEEIHYDVDTTPCGAVHPNYPNVTCIGFGKCKNDWHIGVIEDEYGEFISVYWGKDAERYCHDHPKYAPHRLLK